MGQFLSRSQLPSRSLFRTPRDTERRVQISVVSADLQFARGAQADFVFEGVAVWFQQVLQGMKEGGQAYTDVLRRRQVDTCDPHRPTRSILQADRHTQMSFAVAPHRPTLSILQNVATWSQSFACCREHGLATSEGERSSRSVSKADVQRLSGRCRLLWSC